MKNISTLPALAFLLLFIASFSRAQQNKPRARDLGIPFDGLAGTYNAITDVPGVEVGYKTLILGTGKLVIGQGPVRTGVTAIFPRGKNSMERVFASWFTLNGNGEMTGTTWLKESGCLGSPVLITNTHSVGIVRDAAIAHLEMLPNEKINPIFQAVTSATEEAIVNAMVSAETMEGVNNNKVYAIPHDRLIEILKKYNRIK